MTTSFKFVSLVLLALIALAALGHAAHKPAPTAAPADATLSIHVANCTLVRDSDRIVACAVEVIPVDANGRFDGWCRMNGQIVNSFNPDADGNAMVRLAPGSYRVVVYNRSMVPDVVSVEGIGVGAGSVLTLNFDAQPSRHR